MVENLDIVPSFLMSKRELENLIFASLVMGVFKIPMRLQDISIMLRDGLYTRGRGIRRIDDSA